MILASYGVGILNAKSTLRVKEDSFWEVYTMLSVLRRERLLMQLSLYDLRARTGIGVSKLSLIERGIDQPNEDEKKRLAKALSVRVQDLFPAEEAACGK